MECLFCSTQVRVEGSWCKDCNDTLLDIERERGFAHVAVDVIQAHRGDRYARTQRSTVKSHG